MDNKEYKQQLVLKLRTLIAVLKVAVAKIEKASNMPGANVERLTRITENLENTHEICLRALATLEGTATQPARKVAPSGLREYTELESIDEYKKFQNMPPISAEEVADVDWRDLLEKL